MTEGTSNETFSDKDVADLRSLGITEGEKPEPHAILESWRAVLSPAHSEANHVVSPQYAHRIITSFPEIKFADMNRFRDVYFECIFAMEDVLLSVIDSDDQCLTFREPEEDREHNSVHYRTLLLEWQKLLAEWEKAWRCDDQDAAIKMAVYSEIHRMFFSQTGLVAHLDQIGFQYTEDDREAARVAIEEIRERKDAE